MSPENPSKCNNCGLVESKLFKITEALAQPTIM